MNLKSGLIIACGILALAACSSGGDDIPNVAGAYDCSTNCTGACDFSGTVTITQNDENIIIEADNGNQVGTIDSDGQIDTSTNNGDCNGQVVGTTMILNCNIDSTDCQQVTFKHQ